MSDKDQAAIELKEANEATIAASPRTLIAFEPAELKSAQAQLANWLIEKMALLKKELREFQDARRVAKKNKWRFSNFVTAINRTQKRINYYDRAARAVEAGYLLIPPFPIRVFAVRVQRPDPDSRRHSYSSGVPENAPTNAPAGKGRYVDVRPFIHSQEITDEKGKTEREYWASGYDEVEFPLEAVNPIIMNRAEKALALKIFDEVGLAGERWRDPILIGSVVLKEGYSSKRLNFFLAWWMEKGSL